MHALLKGEDLRAAIGHAGAALVEQNHAAERGQAPKECAEIGRAPGGFDVRHEARDKQQIKRALAKNLVGDVDVVALNVVRGRYLYHYTLHAEAREFSRRTDVTERRQIRLVASKVFLKDTSNVRFWG